MDELSTYPPFATAEDFATFAKRNLDEFDTASVESYLAEAAELIREECEWQVWPQLEDDEMTLDGSGTAELVLPVHRLAGVTSVVECGTELTVDGDDASFDWSRDGILTKRGYGLWTRQRRGVVLVLTHGWVNSPNSLKNLSCAMAGRQFASPLGETRQQAGVVSVSYSSTGPAGGSSAGGVVLTAADKAKLKPFIGGHR